jgi:hypothetical protein
LRRPFSSTLAWELPRSIPFLVVEVQRHRRGTGLAAISAGLEVVFLEFFWLVATSGHFTPPRKIQTRLDLVKEKLKRSQLDSLACIWDLYVAGSVRIVHNILWKCGS